MSTAYQEIFKNIDVESIINRCVECSGASTASSLAKELGLSKSAFSQMKKRNTVPFEACVMVSIEHNADINYLIFGNDKKPEVEKESFIKEFLETILMGIQMEVIAETDDTDERAIVSLAKSMYNKISKNTEEREKIAKVL